MAKKDRKGNCTGGGLNGGPVSRKKYWRVSATHPVSKRGSGSAHWTTGVIGSAMALGLVFGDPAWAHKDLLSKKASPMPLWSISSITATLPTFFPPDILNSESDKAVFSPPEILFIDLGVSGYQDLINAMARDVEIVFLDPNQDGLAAIANHLKDRRDLKGIHIFSHGGPGRLHLGDMVLTADELPERRQDFGTLSQALGPEGDILLYGCDVAKGIDGIRFVNRLAHTLSAGISASNDPTGNPSLGGDWNLEYRHETEVESLFASTVVENFHSLLADGQVIAGDGSGGGGGGGGGEYYGDGTVGGNGGNGGGDADTLTGTVGDDVIFGDGSGGGGGGGGSGKYGAGSGGSGGQSGNGADILHGDSGDDILFGDGFNGINGAAAQKYGSGGAGGASGFGNINGGNGGHGQSYWGWGGSSGSAGFGGALGGSQGTYGFSTGTPGQPGGDGTVTPVTPLDDTGGAIHTDTTAKILRVFSPVRQAAAADRCAGRRPRLRSRCLAWAAPISLPLNLMMRFQEVMSIQFMTGTVVQQTSSF